MKLLNCAARSRMESPLSGPCSARTLSKRYRRGDAKSPEGRWEPKKFNASLYDILMWSMSRSDKNQVMACLDTIEEALIMLYDPRPGFHRLDRIIYKLG